MRADMRTKLQTGEGQAIYARRKAVTELVHGIIKQARSFRQFLLRGLDKVAGEFTLVPLTHNLLKLLRAGLAPTAQPFQDPKLKGMARYITGLAPTTEAQDQRCPHQVPTGPTWL